MLQPRHLGQALICLYQKTLSPDHGVMSLFIRWPVCRYHPTCSEFGYLAIGKYGLLRGGWMTARRLIRCTPWHIGGEDRVP